MPTKLKLRRTTLPPRLCRDRVRLALGNIQIKYQPQINAADKAKFDGYAQANATRNDAITAANLGYDEAMAQPTAELQKSKAVA